MLVATRGTEDLMACTLNELPLHYRNATQPITERPSRPPLPCAPRSGMDR